MSELKNMIITLSQANGTPGIEDDITEKLVGFLPEGMTAQKDKNNNLIASFNGNGKGKTYLLDAHADRIGLIVTAVTEGGFLRVARCGGMDARVLAAQDVTVWGKEPVYGVIISTPPHLQTPADEGKAKDFDDIFVDTGLSKEEAEKLISAGDRITVKSPVCELLNGRISCPALDDRAGCAVIIRAAEIIMQSENAPNLKLLFSAQEETGGTGAVTGSYGIDADECISVDVSFANAPDMPSKKCGKLDKGPMIGFSPVLSYEISRRLEAVAKEKEIPYQLELMSDSTGTNADHIALSRGGIKTGLVSIPLRNMHTAVEVISVNDVENCAQLIAQYILGGGLDA